MAEKNDLDEFGFEPLDEQDSQELEEFGFEPEQQVEPEEMGLLEAGVTGFGSGASFGLTPILAGATSAAVEAGEDIGDVLGLTQDAELREQGFTVPDDNEGLEGLLKAYYEGRDRQKKQEEKAFEDQFAASLTGNILGGMTTFGGAAKAGANLAKGGKTAQALSKILPKAESVKDLSLLQKMGVGAREGLKAGSIAGLGQGEGKIFKEDEQGEITPQSILEGTVDVAKDVATTGAGGATLGGTLPIIGAGASKIKNFVKDLPISKSISLGFKAGKEGLNISDEDQIVKYITGIADDIRETISKNFKGASKKQLLQEADEIGIRVSAGESIEDVINDIKNTGAFGEQSQKELNQFVKDLRSLSKNFDPNMQKAIAGAEKSAAKKAMTAMRKGGTVETSTPLEESFDDLMPMPETQGKVVGVENKISYPSGKQVKDISTSALSEAEVPLKQYDLENMKLSELDEIIRKVGDRADFQGPGDSASPYAKELYARLREASNEAMQSSSLPERNKKLSNLFSALETFGIKPRDFFSKQEKIQDDVQKKLFKKITSGSLSGDLDLNNFTKYLGRADERVAEQIKDRSNFAKDLAKFVRQSEGEGSVSLKAAAGPVQKILAKTGNIFGSGAKTVTNVKNELYKKMTDLTPDQILEFGSQLNTMYGDKATPFVNALTKASQAEGSRKTALMYGIYQQPAFRKMLEDIGKQTLGEEDESAEENSYRDFDSEFTGDMSKKKVDRTPQSVQDIDTKLMDRLEGNKTTGYIPTRNGEAIGQSGVTIAGGLDLGQRTNLNDINISDELKEKFKPYLGLKKQDAQKALQDIPLEVSPEEVQEINNAVKETYFEKTASEYERLTGKNINELPAPVQTVLFSLVFNTGNIGPKTAKYASEGDYDNLIEEVKNWHGKANVDKGLTNRRAQEAQYLQEKLDTLRGTKK